MTRNEMLRYISANKQLADHINKLEGTNFTRLKTTVLAEYLAHYENISEQPQKAPKASLVDGLKSAVIAFLVTLEQKGLLGNLLSEIKD